MAETANDRKKMRAQLKKLPYGKIVLWMVILGLIAIIVYSLFLLLKKPACWGNFVSTLAVGMMFAGGSMMAGALLGFLFGIPRTLQERGPSDGSEANGGNYAPNTNLEQISDWLTKILVGVGLTQLTTLPGKIWNLAELVGKGLGGTQAATIMGLGILTYYFFLGLIVGYLATRLLLIGLLREFEHEDLTTRMKDLKTELENSKSVVEQLESQTYRAASKALDVGVQMLAVQYLASNEPEREDAAHQIERMIPKASPETTREVFASTVSAFRHGLERDHALQMERTIRIIEALIAKDPEAATHEHHAMLGIARSRQRHPDWVGAESELTKAITLRDQVGDAGAREYEAYRAICRIQMDDALRAKKPSDQKVREDILKDLQFASGADPHALRFLRNTDRDLIQEWLQINNVPPEEHDSWELAGPRREF